MSTEPLNAPLARMRPIDGMERRAPRCTPDGRIDYDYYLGLGRYRRAEQQAATARVLIATARALQVRLTGTSAPGPLRTA